VSHPIKHKVVWYRKHDQCMWLPQGDESRRCSDVAKWTWGALFNDRAPIYCEKHGKVMYQRWLTSTRQGQKKSRVDTAQSCAP